MIDPGSARLALVVTPAATRFEGIAAQIAAGWSRSREEVITLTAPPAEMWPFVHLLAIEWPSGPTIVWMPNLHEAFVNCQTSSTRLVTTQASFLLQGWFDAAGDRDVLFLAAADGASLRRHAPEVLTRRGLFADALIKGDVIDSGAPQEHPESLLPRAFRASDPAERLALCVRALESGRTPATLVATASVCMEVHDLEAAGRDLDEALAMAPEWAAAHFERGKAWLRMDDMERASEAFREAASRMPRFGPAWANLGAALGELDRPEQALAAFQQALACDPASHQALNNVGVVNRELGNLRESEVAFRRVTQLAPDLAFGYYNLGHTLFLQGRYQAALAAYIEGQKRDPERNPVQASRLALCRLAAGDATGALTDLQRAASGLPREYRQQLLADANAIVWALLTDRPDLPGWKQVNDWLSRELA